MVKVIKTTLLFILVLFFFWFINSGFDPDLSYSHLQTLIFTIITVILIKRSSFKLFTILLATVLLVVMVLLTAFSLRTVETADFFGSLGFGILMISAVFYIPQLVKQGFVKKL